jgi:mRNA interferase MazF
MNRGEIYWIKPSPYREAIGHVQRAGRPGVIVSSDEINGKGYTYEIVYLTTQPKRDLPTHCTIRSSQEISTALCEQIQTVSSEQLGNQLGTCTQEEMQAINTCMEISLGLYDYTESYDTEESKEDGENDAELDNLWQENDELREKLAKAQAEADVLRRIYNELLEKVLRQV